MADSSDAVEMVINVSSVESNQKPMSPEIVLPLRAFKLTSVLSDDGTRSRTSSTASTAFLNTTSGSNYNNNNNDTIGSNRSRHLSFTRLAYNLSAFNQEFDKIRKEKTNPLLKIVTDPISRVRSTSQGDDFNRGSAKIVGGGSQDQEDSDDQQRQDMSRNASTPCKDDDDGAADTSCRDYCRAFWCSPKQLLSLVTSLFPILSWSVEYNVRESFISDLIAGLTIIVFHVPQSMGYSLIAHVSPVYGLYTAFFPALIYSLMGTSKHCAIGMFAVISLMTGTLIQDLQNEFKGDSSAGLGSQATTPSLPASVAATLDPGSLLLTSASTMSTLLDESNRTVTKIAVFASNIEIAVAVSFLVGFYQLVFGIMQMGFISVYLSEQLVSGFTTAASFYVFTSQLPFLFGVELPHKSGPLALITSYGDLLKDMHKVNPWTIGISLTCCAILLIFKTYVNGKIKERFRVDIPFPIELILVIIGTAASYFLDLNTSHSIAIVDTIPSGLPAPVLPQWNLLILLAKKSIPLAIVAYTLTISVGKIFATRHRYEIDPNQEMIALGSLNIISCFFSCLPSAASLSRSAVQESAGGKTQVVSIINCIGILFVLYFAGSLLEKLPICILASIIAVALKSLFMQVLDFIRYWKVSKLDASIWLITFVAVILLDVDLGLYVGLGYSLLTLIYKSQRPKTYLLGSVGASDVYVPERKYATAVRIPGILIYQFCGPLHFANTEFFKKDLILKTGVSVPGIRQKQDRLRQKQQKRKEALLNGKIVKRLSIFQGGLEAGNGVEATRKSNLFTNAADSQKAGKVTANMEMKQESGNKQENTFIPRDAAAIRSANQPQGEDDRDLETSDFVKTKTGDSLPTHIIIDCSMFSYIDTAGISQLKSTVQDYESIGIKTFLAGIATHVDNMLELDGFYREVPSNHVYITIHDAVHHAQQIQMGEDEDGEEALRTLNALTEEDNCLSYSTNTVSKEEGDERRGGGGDACASLSPAADHLSRFRDRLNNNQNSQNCSSLPSFYQNPEHRSIVGFFDETVSGQKEQKITSFPTTGEEEGSANGEEP